MLVWSLSQASAVVARLLGCEPRTRASHWNAELGFISKWLSGVGGSMHGVSTQLKNATSNNNRYAQKNTASLCPEQSLMLGASALKLSGRFSTFPTRLYSSKVICRHPSSPRLSRSGSTSGWLNSLPYGGGTTPARDLPSSRLTVFNCHSSSCLLAQQHGVIGATIWHALLPSSCFRGTGTATKLANGAGVVNRVDGLHKRFPLTTPFIDGSWNVAGDARPARWLHDSAWLLFGVCSCFSAAAAAAASAKSPTVACCEANVSPAPSSEVEVQVHHGKKVYKEYSIIGIPGDGRCLFRAVAYGVCTKQGKPTANDDFQRELADELRGQVVDELISRRSESEWFIEGDFDQYTERMRQPHVWGGEPELLMLSHVLKLPITVYMSERSSNGLIAIAEYGQEYGKDNPIRVLYDGFGHYDALQIPGEAAQSKL